MATVSRPGPQIPTYDKLIWPTLLALRALGDSASIQEIEQKVCELAGYTDEQQNVLHNDGPMTEIGYRLTWARNYLKHVDAIERSSRGVWRLTEAGRSLQEADTLDIPARVRAKFARRTAPRAANGAVEPELPDVANGEALVDAEERWRDRLLEVLQSLNPAAFERLCRLLLRESGFTKVEVTGRSGDGGIDGIGVLRMALLSFQVLFQCKRYRGSVGPGMVRDFRGAMIGRADKGLLITTGTFTQEALREATRDGAPVLDLIDGEQLCDLLKDRGMGVRTRQVEVVEVDAGWFQGV